MNVATNLAARKQAIHAVITRADGRVEDLGIIAYFNRNPFLHYPVNFYIRLKEFFNGRPRSR